MKPYPPLGLLYVSSHLKACGFEVGVFDSTFSSFAGFLEQLSDEKLAEQITEDPSQPTKSRLEALMSAKEHEMHCRGQLMLIERILGIVPHLVAALSGVAAPKSRLVSPHPDRQHHASFTQRQEAAPPEPRSPQSQSGHQKRA